MNDSEPIDVYDSRSEAYHHAFQVFLDHTDQKEKARGWLDQLVRTLPCRRVFIDAGAGNGKVTSWYADQFEQTIAIEPNPSLCGELRRTCPGATVLPRTILEAAPQAAGDLVLCSHVFYYLERPTWMAQLERLASWLAPAGVLVVALQNHETDCMRMLEHFYGERFDLPELARRFEAAHGDRYAVSVATVPARVATSDLDTAYTVAEFMLNLLVRPQPPTRAAVRDYVRRELASPRGGYRFSCNQDFLQVRRIP
jgi:hypothetical protein